MLDIKLNLQLFAEGGDGGDGGAPASAEGTGEDSNLARIPDRAKDLYRKAVEANKPKEANQPKAEQAKPSETPKEDNKPTHIPFADLIKSDEYKEEHKAYMDKTISDRLKKYKGIEESNAKMNDMLASVAIKYGIDANSDDYLDALSDAINKDDSYIESYAYEHDLSTDEARRSLEMQRKIEAFEAEKRAREEFEAQQAQIQILLQNAERTKAQYPDFDLDTEMQNPNFRNMCAVTGGDTTAAYWAIHHDELMQKKGMQTAQVISQQLANTVAANKSRPIENGLSSQAATITQTDFSNMSLADVRKYAEEQRRLLKQK